jgi:hypothetical protein
MKDVGQLNGNAGKYRGERGGVCISAFCVSVREPAFPSTSLRFANKSIFVNEPAFYLRAFLSTDEHVFLPTSLFFPLSGLPFSQQAFFSINEPVLRQ